MLAATTLRRIRDLVGIPYVYRSRDPETGLDCLSLAERVYAIAGVSFPPPPPYAPSSMATDSLEQWGRGWEPTGHGEALALMDMRPSHVAVCLGDGTAIHCRAGGVVIQRVSVLERTGTVVGWWRRAAG